MKPFRFLLIIILCYSTYSCKKEKMPGVVNNTNDSTTTTNNNTNNDDTTSDTSNSNTQYTISYSGNLWVKEPITFYANAPSGSTLNWSFGDNTTSNDISPEKTYSTVNTFIITLVINGDTLNPIKDTLIIGCGHQRFEGIRSYYRLTTRSMNDNNVITTDTLFNGLTTASITPHNDTSFWFNGDLFEFAPQSNASFLKYTEKLWPYTTFLYYPTNDSISYFGVTPINQGLTPGVIYDKMETQ